MSGLKSAWILLGVLFLVGCGAGETTKVNSGEVLAQQSTNHLSKRSSSGPLSRERQAQVNQSIRSIKNNPLTKTFASTVSYPYIIVGNMPQAKLEHWKRRIQRTQAAIKSMYFKQDPAELVQVWLFKDAASYFHYNQQLWSASPGTSFGYYLPKQKRMMMNIASGGGTLTHELVHPYIEANFPRSPLWFNEGLASLYEQAYYQGGKVFGATNWRLTGLQGVIKAESMPSLEQLMKTNRRQFLGENREIYYAQARYLLFYLQSKGLLGKYYHQFVAKAVSDPTGIDTLLNVTGFKSMQSLETAWVDFVRRLRF